MDVTVYTKENCPACKQTTRFFERSGIPYKEIPLSQVPDMIEKFKASGFMSAPIVVTPHKTWCGFRLDELKMLSHAHRRDTRSFMNSTISDMKAAADKLNHTISATKQSRNNNHVV